MNLLLLMRCDIIDVIILLFLIVYYFYCRRFKVTNKHFVHLSFAALGHVIFGLITEYTVNTLSDTSFINRFSHAVYYIFAIIFCLEFIKYVFSLIMLKSEALKLIIYAYIISAVAIIFILFSKIEFFQGNGIKYSTGNGPKICFLVAFFLLFVADGVIIYNRKIIQKSIYVTLIPITALGLILLIIQVIIPEFLFTESAVTLITLATFFAIENPMAKFQERSFMDFDTQTYNRNAFDNDIAILEKKFSVPDINSEIAFILCDLNDLKIVNDNYGHLEGDFFIQSASAVLLKSLKSAYRIYRIGGDEFIGIYLDEAVDSIGKEAATIITNCKQYEKSVKYQFVLAYGYTVRKKDETLSEAINRADKLMYKKKQELKQNQQS